MKMLFFLSAFFGATCLFAQNINSSQLIELCEKSLGEAEQLLSSRNWYYYTGNDETEDKLGNIRFVYDKPNFVEGSPADYFLVYYFSEKAKANYIELLFGSDDTFKMLTQQLKNLKFDLDSSSTKYGNIVNIYKHAGHIVEVTIPPKIENNTKPYRFMFATKTNYRRLN